MRYSLLALFSLSVFVPVIAHADTITLASQAGITRYTEIQDGGAEGLTGPSAAYYNPAYAAALDGSQWVSTDADGGDGQPGLTYYTDQFTLQPDESYSGTLSFMADDTVGVRINGTEVFLENDYAAFYGPTTINLLSSYFTAGVNTITLEDNNGSGPAAVDYVGSLDGTAVTPEPSSLVLLGTGAVSAAAALRRKMRMA